MTPIIEESVQCKEKRQKNKPNKQDKENDSTLSAQLTDAQIINNNVSEKSTDVSVLPKDSAKSNESIFTTELKENTEKVLDEKDERNGSTSSLPEEDNKNINNVTDEAHSLQVNGKEDSTGVSFSPKIPDIEEHNDDQNVSTMLSISSLRDLLTEEDDTKRAVSAKRNQERRITRRRLRKQEKVSQHTTNSTVKNRHKYLSEEENSKIHRKSMYSSIDFECIETTHAMINTLTLNIYFSICKDDRMSYCLTCDANINMRNNKVPEELVNHVKSDIHKNQLSEMVKDDKRCMKDGKPFSRLGLAREYMRVTNDEFVECLLCGGKNLPNKLKNDDQTIAEHIISYNHQNLKVSWTSFVINDLQTIHKSFLNKKYSARNYCCYFCSYRSPTEIDFIKHLGVLYHRKRLAELYKNGCKPEFHFYFCHKCQYLWFGSSQGSQSHYESIEHKHRIIYGCSLDKIPERVSNILMIAEQKAEILLQLSNQERYNEKISSMLCTLEIHLQRHYPNLRAYPFGSRISDLALPGSDIDIFIDCNNMYEGNRSSYSDSKDLIVEISSFLSNNSQIWKVQNIVLKSRVPIARFLYVPLGLLCDISVTNGLAVENTKLIKVLNQAFPCCRKMILFLKKWLEYSDLLGSYNITNYALTWCVIFYLQKLEVFPSIQELIRLRNKSWKISGWEVGVSYSFTVRRPDFTFEELLIGFFMFYAEFNYDYIICPLLGKPLKKDGSDLKTMALCHTEQFPITSLSVQDPFELSHNLTKAVSKKKLKTFQEYCHYSAQILKKNLSSVNPLLLPI